MTNKMSATILALALTSLAAAAPYGPCPIWSDPPPGSIFYALAAPPDLVFETVAVPYYSWISPDEPHHYTIYRLELGEPGLLLAIAVPYQGNFFVYAADGHAVGHVLGVYPNGRDMSIGGPGTISIWYFPVACEMPDLIQIPMVTLPLAGPIPDDCLIDAWIFTTPRGMSQDQAAQAIADSYAVGP